MAHTHYVAFPAILHDKENDPGTYTVTFPDVPGAISQGSGILQALANGAEALELMLYDGTTKKNFRKHPIYQMCKPIIPKQL